MGAAVAAASKIRASALVVRTESGYSARLMAKYRPVQPIYGVSGNSGALRRMAIYWGITPLHCSASTLGDEIICGLKELQKLRGLPNGSRVVITGNFSRRAPGVNTLLDIRELGCGK